MWVLWILLAFLALYFVIAVKGPSVWDRLLGLNLISTKIVIIILVFASFRDSAYLLDYAIVFALLGFIGTIFVILFWGSKWAQKRGKR
ncbi:MAG: monovalent cation/H+ antiporter complex subunit F [Oscillospiraceae bacterium]|nr:monovalent cation/H+ antiporter complex subunit F [Oscillospiraceae bacterium]